MFIAMRRDGYVWEKDGVSFTDDDDIISEISNAHAHHIVIGEKGAAALSAGFGMATDWGLPPYWELWVLIALALALAFWRY